MSITDPLEDELMSLGESFAIQVLGKVDVAQRILRRLRDEGTFQASRVIALPEGAMARFDDVPDDVETRERLTDLLRRVLDDADLDGDSVVLHSIDGMTDLDDCPRAVVLRMFPPPADRGKALPPALIDMAGDWVFGDLGPAAPVRMRVLGVELSVRVADAGGVLHGCASTGAWCDLLSGDVDDRIRIASISFGTAPHVAIAAGGPGCDDQGLLARFGLLAGVVPELPEWCAYACIDFEEAFDRLALGLATSAWSAEGHAPANRVVGDAGDWAVPDAYPLQLLGPEHLRRLGDAAAGTELEEVGDFGVLRIGDADEWLPDRLGRHTVRVDAWQVMAPLLLEADDLSDADRPSGATGFDAETSGVPDLDHIVIEPGPHARRGTRLSPLELAAWIAGEHHSDEPDAVGPVLSALLRGLAEGLPPDVRHDLAPIVPLAVASTMSDDDQICGVVDWLVRSQAATWLKRAGVTSLGERLADLTDPSSVDGSRRAVALLSDALVTAQRRLDITTAIAGDHADLVEACAWTAWESAADACGWSAASDAVGVGIPAELAAEIERRLVDSIRDRAAGELPDAASATVWSLARGELASFVWHQAWDGAERYIRDESGFDFRTVIYAHLADDLDPDMVADEIDRAAAAALVEAMGTDETLDPFDVGRSADSGPAGDAWRSAMDMTRHVIGEIVFDEALERARREVRTWFDTGPRVITHSAVTVLAREAAGVGARAIAARAAAEAAAVGGSDEACAAAAQDSLRPIVDELAVAVLELTRQLCGPEEASAAIA